MHHDSVADELRAGWLTFAAGTDRRRLAPIPRRWESMKEERLRLALAAATAVVQQRLAPESTREQTPEQIREYRSTDDSQRAEPPN